MSGTRINSVFMLAAAVGLCIFTSAFASGRVAHPSKADSVLASQAKITKKAATAVALAKVPGGVVKSSELEREHGKLIYSFDIAVPGKSGIEEVQISAIDGTVVSVSHEDAKAERREAQKDKSEAMRDSARAKKHT
jgi:hypothetical protein